MGKAKKFYLLIILQHCIFLAEICLVRQDLHNLKLDLRNQDMGKYFMEMIDSHLIKLIFKVLAMLLQLEHLHLLLPLPRLVVAVHPRAGEGDGQGGWTCRR